MSPPVSAVDALMSPSGTHVGIMDLVELPVPRPAKTSVCYLLDSEDTLDTSQDKDTAREVVPCSYRKTRFE